MKITEQHLEKMGFAKYHNPYIHKEEWFIGEEENDQPIAENKSKIIKYDLNTKDIKYIRSEFEVIVRRNITDLWELKEFVRCIQFLYPDISDKIQLNEI